MGEGRNNNQLESMGSSRIAWYYRIHDTKLRNSISSMLYELGR